MHRGSHSCLCRTTPCHIGRGTSTLALSVALAILHTPPTRLRYKRRDRRFWKCMRAGEQAAGRSQGNTRAGLDGWERKGARRSSSGTWGSLGR